MTAPLAWQDVANCATTDPEVMFPETSASVPIKVCQACGVQTECLAYALAEGINYGVWGGTTAEARRKLPGYREQTITAPVTSAGAVPLEKEGIHFERHDT